MNLNKVYFSIKINDKGGIPYRDYNPATLRKLFIESKTAANFEIMALIEGLTYLGCFLYCNITKHPEKYEKILENRVPFGSVINYLYHEGVINKTLKEQIHKYKEKRNNVVHNWLQLKTPLNPKLNEYSYDEVLGELFQCGMRTLLLLHKAITPSKETWEEYVKKFSGLYKRKKLKAKS